MDLVGPAEPLVASPVHSDEPEDAGQLRPTIEDDSGGASARWCTSHFRCRTCDRRSHSPPEANRPSLFPDKTVFTYNHTDKEWNVEGAYKGEHHRGCLETLEQGLQAVRAYVKFRELYSQTVSEDSSDEWELPVIAPAADVVLGSPMTRSSWFSNDRPELSPDQMSVIRKLTKAG